MLSCHLGLSLSTIHVSDYRQFSDIHISQGSVTVATHVRCGRIFKYYFVANLPLGLPVKEFRKLVNIWEVMGKSLVSGFLTHRV